MKFHPRLDNHQNPVPIPYPHTPSPLSTWDDPTQVATVVPESALPPSLHGVAFAPWDGAPKNSSGWARIASAFLFEEPDFDSKGMKPAAGAVIVEPDGRVWLVAPTKAFGGYKATFPKGKTDERDLRATALKEVFEESGLQVELFAHLVDVTKSTSRTRYYLARRIGGSPAHMGWESQAVMLAPPADLKTLLNKAVDHKIVDALLEGGGILGRMVPPRVG